MAEEIVNESQKSSPKKLKNHRVTFACLCVCIFVAIMDTVVVANALPTIASSLQATNQQVIWCGSSYLVAQTTAPPIFGSMAEIVGHKSCVLAALALFSLGSLLCTVAPNIAWLIGSRTVQGAGSGGLNVMANVITANLIPMQIRGLYMGMLSLSGAAGLIVGSLMGSGLAEYSTWRWIFFINLPICIPTGIFICFSLNFQQAKGNKRSLMMQYDWTGLAMFTIPLVLVLYSILAGGTASPWASYHILLPLTLGSCGIIAFIVFEASAAKNPMMPLRIFLDRTAASGYLSAFINAILLWSIGYFLILYFYVTREQSLFQASVSALPGLGTVPPVAAIAGFVMGAMKRFKWLNSGAWVLLVTAMALMSTWTPTTARPFQVLCELLYGVGGGILFPGRLYAVQASQPPHDVAMATTMVSFMTSLGETFGVSVGAAVLQNQWASAVRSRVAAGAIPADQILTADDIARSAEKIAKFPDSVKIIYRQIMSESIRAIWLVMLASALLALVGSLFARNLDLGKQESTEDYQIIEDVEELKDI